MFLVKMISMTHRSELQIYRELIVSLSDEELYKEIWMLDEHIQHISMSDTNPTIELNLEELTELLKIAKAEKEKRMFEKGYM